MLEAKVLIIDDEREHADGLAEAMEKVCGNVSVSYEAGDAAAKIDSGRFDVVVTDLNLCDKINGLDLLVKAKDVRADCEVILITAYATIDTCKEAMRLGAFDYLVKPIDIDELREMVGSAGKKFEEARRGKRIVADSSGGFIFKGVKGKSKAMGSVLRILSKVSPTNLTVVIEGQSGTGKELLARAIHDNSQRKDKAFKPINCAGLTESLLESELFGHAKGAFTGASSERKGLFEIADKGTLFLDEIGDMPLNMQAKLLRVLEDGVVMPVGSEKSIKVDVRVISATNHDLARLVEEKKFRQDLYFRIKGVSVTVPALCERYEDIGELVEFFISEANEDTGCDVKRISEGALRVLVGYNWPGNIRQLRNCIRTMVVMSDGDELGVGDVPADIHRPLRLLGEGASGGDLGGMNLNELEKQAIVDTLAKVEGNREKAAKLLGIGERTLYRKIKDYEIKC